MVIWSVEHDRSKWEQCLADLGGEQYTQAWGWGEHRSRFGWEPVRCLGVAENGRPVAMVQFLVRRLPAKIGIVWIPGGLIGAVATWAETLFAAVKSASGLRHLLLKISALRPYRSEDAIILRMHGWMRTRDPLTSGLSMMWDLGSGAEERMAKLTPNWRHNLKRSNKYGLLVERWDQPDPAAIAAVYAEMEGLKGLSPQYSFDEIASALRSMGERLLFYRCLDHDGKLVALRACVIVGDQAWDFMAAAGGAARKAYASYALLWNLAQDCHQRGVRQYDLAGIDPQGNKGVWDFKRGTGARGLEYLGEWELASSGWIGAALNFVIGLRRGRN